MTSVSCESLYVLSIFSMRMVMTHQQGGRSKELGLEKARICGGFLLFTDWHCDQMPREHNNLNVIGLSISHIMENISGRKQSPTKNFVGYHWCTVSRYCNCSPLQSHRLEIESCRTFLFPASQTFRPGLKFLNVAFIPLDMLQKTAPIIQNRKEEKGTY